MATLPKGCYPLSRNVSVRTHIKFTPGVTVKVERGSTFTFTRDLPCIVSFLFTRVRAHVKTTRQWKSTLRVDCHCRVLFTCVNVKVPRGSTSTFTRDPPYITSMLITRVNEIEAMYERPRVNVNVERDSTFTYTRDIPYIVSILFTRVRTEKLRDSGNPP